MIRIDYTKEWDDSFYEHYHLSFPNEATESHLKKLDTNIRNSLKNFLDKIQKNN